MLAIGPDDDYGLSVRQVRIPRLRSSSNHCPMRTTKIRRENKEMTLDDATYP
jgi:hypothetical protein